MYSRGRLLFFVSQIVSKQIKFKSYQQHKRVLSQLSKPVKMREYPALLTDSPEFRGIFTAELQALIDIFQKYSYELRIAGGAVCDIIMEIKPKDVDLATTATPEQMKEMFNAEGVRMINTKGEKHGTITPRIHNKENFEITTLRIDVRTDGRHADVQFTKDWQLDASRRDLTINSMFLGFDGTLYDYCNGYDHLQKRHIEFVGDPNVRIQEDFLRILRYFRFYGRIACDADQHDASTIKAIRENAEGLSGISGERIWSEMQKIVVGNFNRQLVEKMVEVGVTEFCGLSDEPNLEEFQRFCDTSLKYVETCPPILFMTALLHTHDDAINMHFRLKLSAFERDLAFFLTLTRDKVDKEFQILRDYQKLCLRPAVHREFVEELLRYSNKFELYSALRSWSIPSFPLNGNLLKEHGCPLGRKMGIVMMELRNIWADSDFQLTAKELLEKHLPEVLSNLTTPPTTPAKRICT